MARPLLYPEKTVQELEFSYHYAISALVMLAKEQVGDLGQAAVQSLIDSWLTKAYESAAKSALIRQQRNQPVLSGKAN